jgi:hypothetical protein
MWDHCRLIAVLQVQGYADINAIHQAPRFMVSLVSTWQVQGYADGNAIGPGLVAGPGEGFADGNTVGPALA